MIILVVLSHGFLFPRTSPQSLPSSTLGGEVAAAAAMRADAALQWLLFDDGEDELLLRRGVEAHGVGSDAGCRGAAG